MTAQTTINTSPTLSQKRQLKMSRQELESRAPEPAETDKPAWRRTPVDEQADQARPHAQGIQHPVVYPQGWARWIRKNPQVDQENAASADPMREIPIRRAAQNVPSPPQSV